VRNGTVITPPISAGALEGITQASVITILEDMGYKVEKGNIARSDLYIAEEIFCVGTAAEVSAINSVDDRSVPCPGPITLKVADTYGKAVRGQISQYKAWCELA
jgi:branched-chain amino acid aminotransferase